MHARKYYGMRQKQQQSPILGATFALAKSLLGLRLTIYINLRCLVKQFSINKYHSVAQKKCVFCTKHSIICINSQRPFVHEYFKTVILFYLLLLIGQDI